MPAANNASPKPSPDDEQQQSVHVRWLASDRAQTLANVMTIIVAFFAIILSVWEGYENRMHNRLSVLPHLEPVEVSISGASIDSEYFLLAGMMDSVFVSGYALENSGLGPAVLQNLLVFKNGEKIYDAKQSDSSYHYQDVRYDLTQLPFQTGFLNKAYSRGQMLQAGKVHPLLTVPVPFSAFENPDSLDFWPPGVVERDVLERRSFVFCYCSVYGEDCGTTHLGAEPPSEDVCSF